MKLSEYQLNADLKAGKLARIYVLYGEEDFLIRTYTDRIINLAVPQDAREMNFVKYSLVPGADETSRGDRPPSVEELSDVVLSMPFFSERKCILLKNFDPDMLSKDEFSDYLAMFSDIPETSAVIITRENTEDDPKRFKEKIDKAKMKKLLETGLTDEEKSEQDALRNEYRDNIRKSLNGQLERTYVIDENGNKRKLVKGKE